MPAPLRIFVSYAHIDEAYKDRLSSHLAVLRRKKLVDVWHDRQIDGGDDWRADIRQAMDDCSLALLLVSDTFLNSEFIQSEEMEYLWQRRQKDGIRLAPIIVRPCPWKLDDKLGALQAMPKDGKPLISFSQTNGARDQAWTDIAYKIAEWANAGEPSPVVQETPLPAVEEAIAVLAPTSPPATPRNIGGLLGFVGRLMQGIAAKAPSPPPRPALPPEPMAAEAEATPGAPPAAAPVAVNPFDPWDEAVPPRFVGRTDLLRRLAQALDEKRSVSLVGDWRIGKTSILHTWRMKATDAGRIVRFVSGEGPEAVSCAAFVAAVTGGPATPDDPDAAADRLSTWAEAASPAGLPPLILIDEADRMLTRFPHRFFERLRGMLGRICLVLSTRQEVDRIYAADNSTSPFINRLEMQRVGLLDEAAAEALIAQGGDVLTDEDRDLMRTWAGGHPYYLTLLGRHLWDARREGGSTEDALGLFQDEAAARLRELWRTLDDSDRQQLDGLLKGDAVDGQLVRRGLVVAGKAFGGVMTEWLNSKRT